MAQPLRSDPIRNFKFQVQINHSIGNTKLAKLGFMSVSGLQVTTEMIPYREGGMNTTTRKMPGQSDFPPVTLTRGMFGGNAAEWKWFCQIFNYMAGTAGGPQFEPDFRTNIIIRVLPHPTAATNGAWARGGGAEDVFNVPGRGIVCYKLYNAWPLSLAFSDLDAGGNGIIMTQMTLAHEGLRLIPAKRVSVAGNTVFQVPASAEQS